jgi:hypothetical protein
MEKIMRLPVTAFAALVVIGSGAVAEPPKPAPAAQSRPAKPEQRPTEIVLASADAVAQPGADRIQPAKTAAKPHVTPRVTHCRCGDGQVDPEDQDQ